MDKRKKVHSFFAVLVLVIIMLGMAPVQETYAATDEAKAEFQEMVIEMFQTGDTSTKDISDLKLTWSEYNEIFWDVIANECWLEYQCCYNSVNQSETYTENGVKYVKNFYVLNMDSNLPEFTAAARKHIEYINSQIDSQMTDLDKLVLIHDYIDKINSYDLNAPHGYIHSATGPLFYGSSVCDGYAKAMNLLLNAVGVEADTVGNDTHGWSLVKIDGEYYHVDATWDDTRTGVTGSYRTHYFMMRNDDEYRNDTCSPHTGFKEWDSTINGYKTTFSTSTKFTDWYVHSVIGDMYYYDGYWYYVQDGSIVKNEIYGTADSCVSVVSGTGLTVTGITDGVLSYTENSVEKTLSLSEEEETEMTLDEAKAEFRKILIDMIETGDSSKRDISHLKLTYNDYYPIYQDVIENECRIAYSCYYNAVPQTEKDADGYVLKFWFYYVDPDFQTQYAAIKEQIAYVHSQLDPDMTDLDKVLWIHDYLISITTYKDSDDGHKVTSVGPLYKGEAVCTGYARALATLLYAEGIETYQVYGDNHQWIVVLIDGELYHVDATWDDTRSTRAGVSGKHYFLMRTDDEFMNDAACPHNPKTTNFQLYNPETKLMENTNCTSTTYTDWYVHSVSGDMYYYNGYWYYVQDDSIQKNNIQGTDCSIVVSGTDITLQGITDGVLKYTLDSEEKTIQLSDDGDGTGDNEDGNTTGGNQDDESGNTTGGDQDDESGNTTGGNQDDESGNTTGGNQDDESGNTTGGNQDDESGNTTGGNQDDESGNTTGGNQDDESGNTTGGNKDDESGNATGGTEENESGNTTGGNQDAESGNITGGDQDDESGNTTGGNQNAESGNTTGGNQDNESGNTTGGNQDAESGNTTDGNQNGESGSTTGGTAENATGNNGSDTSNTSVSFDGEYQEDGETSTQFTFKDKKSKAYYKVLTKGEKTGTVVYVKPYASAKGKVTIPATVKKDGVTYKVIGISANAFKNNKKITQIVIGKNVKTIGSKAFYNCKKLKSITVKTTKLTSSSVKKTAFKGISKNVTVKVTKSKYSKYKKLFVSKGLKSKTQVVKK